MKTPKTYDEAVVAFDKAKSERKAANEAMDAFLDKNGLKKKKDYSENKEHGKEYKALAKTLTTAREDVKTLEPLLKELKPQTERPSKYEYPADITSEADKKKYRAKMRREAANEGKPAKEEKPKKEKKVKETEAAGETEAKEKKKKKKDKEKKAKAED